MNKSIYPNLSQSLLLCVFYFVPPGFFLFLTLTVPQLLGFQLPILYVTIISVVAATVCLLPIIIYINKKSAVQIKWSVKLPNLYVIFLLALLAVSTIIISSPLNKPEEFIKNLLDGRLKLLVFHITEFDLNMVIRFIGSVFIAPIFEEIIFRKQILGLLLRKYSPGLSIVFSSIIFAAVHLRFNDIGSLFIWGILLGIVYYKTRSIEASILLHSFSNIFIYIVMHEFKDITGLLLFKYVSMMVVCFVVMFLIIKYLTRYGKAKKFNGPEVPDGSFPAYRQ